jgi:hypothetical protein
MAASAISDETFAAPEPATRGSRVLPHGFMPVTSSVMW